MGEESEFQNTIMINLELYFQARKLSSLWQLYVDISLL